jgi:hypothetical protein
MGSTGRLELRGAMGDHRVMRALRLAGLILWRSGLLLVGGYGLFRVARLALRFAELPLQLEIGAGLVLAGLGLVLGSLIWERVLDAREEGDLSA